MHDRDMIESKKQYNLRQSVLADALVLNMVEHLEKVLRDEIEWYTIRDNFINKFSKYLSIIQDIGREELSLSDNCISKLILLHQSCELYMPMNKIDCIHSLLIKLKNQGNLEGCSVFDVLEFDNVTLDYISFIEGRDLITHKRILS